MAIHWLHCRAGLTWSLFLTHPLFVLNLKLSFSACSAVGLAAMSGPASASTASPEGLQKACAFVSFNSKSVCGHGLLHTWGCTECPDLVLSFPQPERLPRHISPSQIARLLHPLLSQMFIIPCLCSPPALAAQHPDGRGHPAPLHKANPGSFKAHLFAPGSFPRWIHHLEPPCSSYCHQPSPVSADHSFFKQKPCFNPFADNAFISATLFLAASPTGSLLEFLLVQGWGWGWGQGWLGLLLPLFPASDPDWQQGTATGKLLPADSCFNSFNHRAKLQDK